MELGVNIETSEVERKVLIKGDNTAVITATAIMKDYIDDPCTLTSREQELVHIFVDNSNIYLGSQYIPQDSQESRWGRNLNIRIKQKAILGTLDIIIAVHFTNI